MLHIFYWLETLPNLRRLRIHSPSQASKPRFVQSILLCLHCAYLVSPFSLTKIMLLKPLFVLTKHNSNMFYQIHGRRGGLVVERRTPEREVGGSIQVAVLYP